MAEIGFIGMGNMGLAILHGLLKTCEPGRFIFTAAHAEKMAAVTEATGVIHAESNRACAQNCKYLILAVKPQYFDIVFDEIREVLKEDQVVISLAPGQTISGLKERLGDEIRVVRARPPNTPAMLGAGMTGIAFGTDSFTLEEQEQICTIFKSCGGVELVEERQMEAVGCVSGCSPAFVYMFIEALADSGVKYGLPRKTACEMAAQTVLGSAKMVLGTGWHPGAVKGRGLFSGRNHHCGSICSGRIWIS